MVGRFDTSEWTQASDRREDRADYSDWTDEDTGTAAATAARSAPAMIDWPHAVIASARHYEQP